MSDSLSLVIGASSSWVYASLKKKEERGERIPGGKLGDKLLSFSWKRETEFD